MSVKTMDFEFTHLVCDEDANRILSIACNKDVSIKEISEALGIPMSRCYRRVHEMLEKGLLRVDKLDENRAALYRSNLRSFFITFENERLSLMVEYDNGRVQSFSYNVDSMAMA
jgi:DNA-binding Lrp family transcriptional regulator